MKKNKACLTNLAADNSSCLPLHKRERVRIDLKSSQALGTCSASDSKATIRVNLMRDNKATTADAALAKKAFGSDIGEHQ